MEAAKEAPGNIFARGTPINETFHTLTIWEDRGCMLQYMHSVSHAGAMQMFDQVAKSGKVYGYETPGIKFPSWDELRRIYDAHGRPMRGKALQRNAKPLPHGESEATVEKASDNSSKEFAIAAN